MALADEGFKRRLFSNGFGACVDVPDGGVRCPTRDQTPAEHVTDLRWHNDACVLGGRDVEVLLELEKRITNLEWDSQVVKLAGVNSDWIPPRVHYHRELIKRAIAEDVVALLLSPAQI
jgi:hypothetical protein